MEERVDNYESYLMGCPECAKARSASQFQLSIGPQGPLLAHSGHVQQCVNSLFPRELAKHAVSAGMKAVKRCQWRFC